MEATYLVYILKSICNIDSIHVAFLTVIVTEKKLKSISIVIINFKSLVLIMVSSWSLREF